MVALFCLFLALFASPFKSKSRLEAENAALRHQLIILRRKVRGRVRLTNSDRLFFIQLYRWFPSVLKAITIVRPETLVRWHRAGFRRYWRWKSRSLGGRPQRIRAACSTTSGTRTSSTPFGTPSFLPNGSGTSGRIEARSPALHLTRQGSPLALRADRPRRAAGRSLQDLVGSELHALRIDLFLHQ
jgi:hypothetical protein